MEDNNIDESNVVEMPQTEGTDPVVEEITVTDMEVIEMVPTVPTLASACSGLFEHFGISKAGMSVLDIAVTLMNVAQEVTKLENIDFTSKAAINRSCTGARAEVLTALKKLAIIRKGGIFSEVIAGPTEEDAPVAVDVEFAGFMALRDNACENVAEINRKATLELKKKEHAALLAEIEALEKEEAAE